MSFSRVERQPAYAGSATSSCMAKILLILVMLLTSATLVAAAVSSSSASARQRGDCQVSEKFPQKILQWCEPITYYAQEAGLHPDLVAALIWQESGGNARAYSRSGAVGLMQVMPRDGLATRFQCKDGPCFRNRPTMSALRNPEFNLEYGTQMLRSLVRRHGGDLRKALRDYGPMDAGYSYADIVLSLYRQYKD